MRKEKGFTLIELMVVIVIIAILAAVAFPNFMGATEKARESAVTSAVKALQTSLEMYAVDNNGSYPSTGTDSDPNALTAISEYLPNRKFPNNPVNNTAYAYDNGLLDVAPNDDPKAAAEASGESYCIVYSSDGVAYTLTGFNRDNSKAVITLSNH